MKEYMNACISKHIIQVLTGFSIFRARAASEHCYHAPDPVTTSSAGTLPFPWQPLLHFLSHGSADPGISHERADGR